MLGLYLPSGLFFLFFFYIPVVYFSPYRGKHMLLKLFYNFVHSLRNFLTFENPYIYANIIISYIETVIVIISLINSKTGVKK